MPNSGVAGFGQYLPHLATAHVSSARCGGMMSGWPKMACQRCSMRKASLRSGSPTAECAWFRVR